MNRGLYDSTLPLAQRSCQVESVPSCDRNDWSCARCITRSVTPSSNRVRWCLSVRRASPSACIGLICAWDARKAHRIAMRVMVRFIVLLIFLVKAERRPWRSCLSCSSSEMRCCWAAMVDCISLTCISERLRHATVRTPTLMSPPAVELVTWLWLYTLAQGSPALRILPSPMTNQSAEMSGEHIKQHVDSGIWYQRLIVYLTTETLVEYLISCRQLMVIFLLDQQVLDTLFEHFFFVWHHKKYHLLRKKVSNLWKWYPLFGYFVQILYLCTRNW